MTVTAENTEPEPPVALTPALRHYLLALADDEHLMGQHHTEWIGVAPFLEEDLAFSSIGQDELGHAVMIYELMLTLEGTETTDGAVDALAFGRDASSYRSCVFTEYPATEWAETLVRHWIYDSVEELRWGLLADSSMQPLREIAARAEREEVFHRRHADALVDTLLRSDDGRTRILGALEAILPMVPSLLQPTDDEADIVDAGIASASVASLQGEVDQRIADRFGAPSNGADNADGHDRRVRSSHFDPLMTRMREVLDLDPGASW